MFKYVISFISMIKPTKHKSLCSRRQNVLTINLAIITFGFGVLAERKIMILFLHIIKSFM